MDRLGKLDAAIDVSDMDVPGWRLHPLKGRLKGRYAVRVSSNWRLTFEFASGDASLVDYEDYH
jgi:proteic killer suppression protein